MSATERLHYEDSLALTAEATVLAHATHGGAPSVILDRTPFYPEAGGQLGDHGCLARPAAPDEELEVLDAQLDETGVVHHLVRGPAPALGERVIARVDEHRRRTHMALHTGQHALSRALLDLHAAETLSSRLGASVCTLDVDRELDLDAAREAEALVNRVIDEDRPVAARFVDDAEVARLALRKPPPSVSKHGSRERVRVVEIAGLDLTPCGGTHVVRTAEIGLLVITGVERYKGGTRVSFEAGPRARRWLNEGAERLRALSLSLRCAPAEVASVVDGLRQKLDEARRESGALRARLADAIALGLAAGDLHEATIVADDVPSRIVASLPDVDAALLRAVADRLATGARLVVLGAPSDGGTALVVARGPASEVHAGELLKAIAARHGGRGGGRPNLAEGRVPGRLRVEDDAASLPPA